MAEGPFLAWGGVPQCSLCDRGHPVTFLSAPSGDVALCIECSMRVLQISMETFELMHREYRDHLGEKLQRAWDKEAGLSRAVRVSRIGRG